MRPATNRTLLARDAYTYLHVVIVAAYPAQRGRRRARDRASDRAARGAELPPSSPGRRSTCSRTSLFRLRMTGTVACKRLAGAIACVAVGAIGSFASALVVAALLLAVLVAVIVADQLAGRRARRGEPSPLERLEASAGS